jgi:hypothetical protein
MFGGPDTYMAVVVVPDDVAFDEKRTPLQIDRLRQKDIMVYHCGEFYHNHTSNRAKKYQAALQESNRILAQLQQQEWVLRRKLESQEVVRTELTCYR